MKIWSTPVLEELNITETAHGWTGFYRDGGYIGDGHFSGHLTWDKPEGHKKPEEPENPEEFYS